MEFPHGVLLETIGVEDSGGLETQWRSNTIPIAGGYQGITKPFIGVG